MKKKLLLACSLLGLSLSSCYLDPYASNVGINGGFSNVNGGFSNFGGGGFNSTFFVGTGDPRWAYDPSLFCYFDLNRRCYYDPFLFGYYPVGYVPIGLRGCPHPYGWNGNGLCPVPRSINSRILSRYDQRLNNVAAADYHWARRVSASGSSRWLGNSERNTLYQRALAPNSPSRVDGWMNGRGLSGSNERNFNQAPQPSIFSSSRSAPSNGNSTYTQPRQSRGGLFGGLDRSRDTRQSTPAPQSYTPSTRQYSPAPSSSTMRGSLGGGSSYSAPSGGSSNYGGSSRMSGGSSSGGGSSSSGQGLRGFR